MPQLLLHNARLVLPDGVRQGSVLVRDGRIASVISDGSEAPTGLGRGETLDLAGDYLAPGLIDLHIHGSAGIDVMDAGKADFATLSRFLLSEGVTAYFATLVPADDEGYGSAVKSVNAYVQEQRDERDGARLVGIHFEGPYLNKNRCGALRPHYFRTYSFDERELEPFLYDIPGVRRVMTLAPEVDGGIELVRELTRRDVRVFLGHSEAQPEILDRAVDAGAHHITHFPNALDPLHHRKPGAVGWGLVRDEVTLDCIADFHHVDPLMLRLIYRSKSWRRMALISDAILPAGLGDGEYQVWGEKIFVRHGRTGLAEGPSKGTIAGSVITLREAIINMTRVGVPMHEAVHMASLVPAREAGIDGDYGSLEPGKRADLVAMNDELEVQLVITGDVTARKL